LEVFCRYYYSNTGIVIFFGPCFSIGVVIYNCLDAVFPVQG